MKRLAVMILALMAISFAASSAEAVTNAVPAGQVRIQIGQSRRHRQFRRNNHRVFTQTRIVQRGRQRFRETYQVTYGPNGRAQTRVISRVRIG